MTMTSDERRILEAEITDAVMAYRDHFNAGDAHGLAEMYTQDSTFVNLGGATFSGREAIWRQQADGFDGVLARITIELRVEEVATLGDGHAIARMHQTIGDQNPHETALPVPPTAVLVMIFQRASGAWLIRHLQSTPSIEQAESHRPR